MSASIAEGSVSAGWMIMSVLWNGTTLKRLSFDIIGTVQQRTKHITNLPDWRAFMGNHEVENSAKRKEIADS